MNTMTTAKWNDIWNRFDVITEYQDDGVSSWKDQEKVLRNLLQQRYGIAMTTQQWKKFSEDFKLWFDCTCGSWDQQKAWIVRYINKAMRNTI